MAGRGVKRLRCKKCGERINVDYKIKNGKIIFTCPKCLAQGEYNVRKTKRNK
ncbi:MAG: hypothetical protein WC979_09945 [Candidatus Pacearchaeota archaeon]|jgi:RNase P subunit RPR2